MAPRQAVPIREIVYSLSPYNQDVIMKGITKTPTKIAKYFQRNFVGLAIFSTVLFGPILYANEYKAQETLEHRY